MTEKITSSFLFGIHTLEQEGLVAFKADWETSGVHPEVVITMLEAYLRKAKRDYQRYFEKKTAK